MAGRSPPKRAKVRGNPLLRSLDCRAVQEGKTAEGITSKFCLICERVFCSPTFLFLHLQKYPRHADVRGAYARCFPLIHHADVSVEFVLDVQ